MYKREAYLDTHWSYQDIDRDCIDRDTSQLL